MTHVPLSRSLVALGTCAVAALLLLDSRPSQAEQFILVDETITMTKADADRTGSHHFIRNISSRTGVPRDWTAPVDYRNGTVHTRVEVIEKPSAEPNQWSLCYIPNRGTGNGYGCSGSGIYQEKGVYRRQESMTAWWENRSIVWNQGVKEMHLVVKDMDGASGHLHKRRDPQNFFPFTVRITMVQVSAGGTYDPSIIPNANDPVDAGPADAGAADAGAGGGNEGMGGAGGAMGGGGGESGSGEGAGGATGSAGSGGDPTPPGSGEGGKTGGAPGGSAGGSGGSGDSAPSGAGGSGDKSGEGDRSVSGVTGGCSVSGGPGHGPDPFLGLLAGLLLSTVRTRRRRSRRNQHVSG